HFPALVAINQTSYIPRLSRYLTVNEAAYLQGFSQEYNFGGQSEQAGVKANFIHAALRHDNSSTLNSGFQTNNDLTFQRNHKLFEKKVAEQDYSEGNWSLQIRRANSWEK
ncbi:MAG: hypothetical protein EBU12_03195, partial [Microbacteriaceae bacterium]|nr:hypothetical protein [Microbacteriaceae bacterium]